MVRTISRTGFVGFLAALLLLSSGQSFAQQDPPSRVARLNYLSGNVSMEPAGVDDWAPADLNRPFTVGDYLYADQGAQAELHLDVAAIRMGPATSFGFLNLDDRTVQLKLTEGDLYIHVHNFGADQTFEVDTPNAAVTLLRDGIYRFRVDANGSMSFVVVRQGSAEITGGGQAFTLNPGNSAMLTGTDQLAYDVETAPAPDEFDQWCEERDTREAQFASARYLPPTVIGSEDLGSYGDWQDSGSDGPVWYPRSVDDSWAPYRNGHWVWIAPWGWTWVDSMPWGFAPFHYGRWAYIGNRWGWCPGPIGVRSGGPIARPYYAPAMVAWFGGANWGVGISIGGGPSVGWVPLGRGEVYTPAYHCSPRYFNNVNVSNTRIVNNVNITNVYNNVYVNKQVYNQQYVNVRAPNAVMSMPQNAFASGRSAQQAATPVRQAQFAKFQNVAVTAPPVSPTRQSFVAARPVGQFVARPANQVMQRQVIARNIPPPAPRLPASGPGATPVVANVRQAPPAQLQAVRPGVRVGNPAAAYNRSVPANQSNNQPVQQAARPTHGTPPNIQQPRVEERGQDPVQQTAPSRQQPNVTERSQTPAYQTQPVRPQPPPGERTQTPVQETAPARQQQNAREQTQTPTYQAPPVRSEPASGERTQAPPREPVPARQQANVQERTESAPQKAAYPERRPLNEERTQPANKPAEHKDVPKDEHPKEDHPKKDK